MADQSNRIEVDLKLFQSKEINALAEFGKNIEKSVELLQQLTASFNGQLSQFSSMGKQRGSWVGQAGQQSPIASPWAGTYQRNTTDQQIRDDRGKAVERRQGLMEKLSWAPGSINPYERAQLHLGRPGEMTGLDAIRYASYVSGIGGYRAVKNEAGEIIGNAPRAGIMSAGARGISGILGGAARAGVMGINPGMVAEMVGVRGQARALGSTLNISGGGLGGTEIFGNAWQTNLQQKYQALTGANFGIGSITTDDTKAIQQQLTQYGYDTTGRAGKGLFELSKGFKTTAPGMDTGYVNQVLEQTKRFQPERIKDISETLSQMGDSAHSARMGLEAFTQGVQQGATQISQSTGLGVADATKMAQQFAAGTGLNPSMAGGVIQAMRLGPAGMRNISKHRGNMLAATKDIGGLVQSGIEILPPEIRNLLHGVNRKNQKQVTDKIMEWYLQPGAKEYWESIMGPIGPAELVETMVRTGGDLKTSFHVVSQLEKAYNRGDNIHGLSRSALTKDVKAFGGLLDYGGEHEAISKKALLHKVSGMSNKEATKEIAKAMGIGGRSSKNPYTHTVKLELAGDAKKLLKFSGKELKNNPDYTMPFSVPHTEGETGMESAFSGMAM